MVCSCSTHKRIVYFRIFESIDNGPFDPTFITLKGRSFEIYDPAMPLTTIGTWKTRGDTLICYPFFDYIVQKDKIYIDYVNDSIKTVTSIPMYYLIKEDMLLEITDYSQIDPSLKELSTQYKMIK